MSAGRKKKRRSNSPQPSAEEINMRNMVRAFFKFGSYYEDENMTDISENDIHEQIESGAMSLSLFIGQIPHSMNQVCGIELSENIDNILSFFYDRLTPEDKWRLVKINYGGELGERVVTDLIENSDGTDKLKNIIKLSFDDISRYLEKNRLQWSWLVSKIYSEKEWDVRINDKFLNQLFTIILSNDNNLIGNLTTREILLLYTGRSVFQRSYMTEDLHVLLMNEVRGRSDFMDVYMDLLINQYDGEYADVRFLLYVELIPTQPKIESMQIALIVGRNMKYEGHGIFAVRINNNSFTESMDSSEDQPESNDELTDDNMIRLGLYTILHPDVLFFYPYIEIYFRDAYIPDVAHRSASAANNIPLCADKKLVEQMDLFCYNYNDLDGKVDIIQLANDVWTAMSTDDKLIAFIEKNR